MPDSVIRDAFACNVRGGNLMGKNAQEITEMILKGLGLLQSNHPDKIVFLFVESIRECAF